MKIPNHLLKKIIEEYGLKFDDTFIKLEPLDQYPHMFKIVFSKYTLIVKTINKAQTHCDNINLLYSHLEDNEYVLKPETTKNGKYCINNGETITFVYKRGLPALKR